MSYLSILQAKGLLQDSCSILDIYAVVICDFFFFFFLVAAALSLESDI